MNIAAPVPYIAPHTLTPEEVAQVEKIKHLLGQGDDSILRKSIAVPTEITLTDKLSLTEKATTKVHSISTSAVYTVAFHEYMDGGYWYNMGCTDLKNFMSWIKDGTSTVAGRKEFKAQLYTYTTTTYTICTYSYAIVFEVLIRLLCHYASTHEDMAAVNTAFHKYLRPPWPVVRELLLGADAGKQPGTEQERPGCQLALLPREVLRLIVTHL